MLREIINSADRDVMLHLPEELVGKTVEVIAFEVIGVAGELERKYRLQQIEELTKDTLVNLSTFKFDRNEANNYDE